MRVARRTRYLFFHAEDLGFFDVAAMLRGEVRPMTVRQIYAIAILTGAECALTHAELTELLAIPANESVELDETPTLRRFAEHGLIVTDDPAPELARLRQLDERLDAGAWNLYGALYHSLTRWRDVDAQLREETQAPEARVAEAGDEFVRRFGPPPPHFYSANGGGDARELPLVRPQSDFYRTLERRQTTRWFTREGSIGERELAILLYYVFGAQGYIASSDRVVGLRKTSPSGGALHPIEVYLLAISVEGVDPGLYHYHVGQHALEPLSLYPRPRDASRRAIEFSAGQFYFREAAAIFVLTARFPRSFWKYRNNEKAFGVVLMDAGHLSQTFQLVCAELGLGSFVTAAINAANIDDALGIDGFDEGALALVGCGARSEEQTFLQPPFSSYVPRETRL